MRDEPCSRQSAPPTRAHRPAVLPPSLAGLARLVARPLHRAHPLLRTGPGRRVCRFAPAVPRARRSGRFIWRSDTPVADEPSGSVYREIDLAAAVRTALRAKQHRNS